MSGYKANDGVFSCPWTFLLFCCSTWSQHTDCIDQTQQHNIPYSQAKQWCLYFYKNKKDIFWAVIWLISWISSLHSVCLLVKSRPHSLFLSPDEGTPCGRKKKGKKKNEGAHRGQFNSRCYMFTSIERFLLTSERWNHIPLISLFHWVRPNWVTLFNTSSNHWKKTYLVSTWLVKANFWFADCQAYFGAGLGLV